MVQINKQSFSLKHEHTFDAVPFQVRISCLFSNSNTFPNFQSRFVLLQNCYLEIAADTSRAAAVSTAPLDDDELLPELFRVPTAVTELEEPECRCWLLDRADLPPGTVLSALAMMAEGDIVAAGVAFDLSKEPDVGAVKPLLPESVVVNVVEAVAMHITAGLADSLSLLMTPPAKS